MMATPLRTKQVNLRFPLPLLSQIKSKADAKQQAIADWILAVVSREFDPEKSSEPLPNQNQSNQAPSPFILHPELLEYIKSCLDPLQSEIIELRTQMGES
jgi:hypothetical protein